LKGFVTVGEAEQRWAALKQFYDTHGHFLVTNGPYRLEKWSEDSAVLQVFRDLSYPLGVGAFDGHVLPPRAYISRVEIRNNSLRIFVDIEKAVRSQRSYTFVREPLARDSLVGPGRIQPVCSYVVLRPDGVVLMAGAALDGADGTFTVDLKGLKPGRYTVVAAIYLSGNQVNPDVKAVPYRVEQ
jgi:hypothetical protein